MKRIAELDGLRAIAVGMVIVAHCQTIAPLDFGLGRLFDGNSGVIIFFVLSGFLITRILLAEMQAKGRISLGSFYGRRAIRILPASYFYLLVVAALSFVGFLQVPWQQLLLAFLHGWNYGTLLVSSVQGGNGSIVLGHFWSLALEEQFYWIWPPVLMALSIRRSSRLLVAIILGMAIIRLGTYAAWPLVRGNLGMMFHTAIDPLAIGALIAIHEQPLKKRIASVSAAPISLAIVMLLLVVPVIKSFMGAYWTITYGKTLEAALAGFVIMAMIYRPEHGFASILRSAPFQFVGKISFSLYLWQQAFCIVGGIYPMHPILAIPASIAAAAASYYWIELPFLRLRRQRAAEPLPD